MFEIRSTSGWKRVFDRLDEALDAAVNRLRRNQEERWARVTNQNLDGLPVRLVTREDLKRGTRGRGY